MLDVVYYVYVVELAAVGRVRVMADLYVGSSALAPKERFGKHLDHTDTASRHVKARGVRLRPDLYRDYPPFVTRAAAKRAEKKLADVLEARGHKVYGACRPSRTKGCEDL